MTKPPTKITTKKVFKFVASELDRHLVELQEHVHNKGELSEQAKLDFLCAIQTKKYGMMPIGREAEQLLYDLADRLIAKDSALKGRIRNRDLVQTIKVEITLDIDGSTKKRK